MTIELHDLLQALYFFMPAYVANMAPVLVKGHFERLAIPMDRGRTFHGKRIFGDHKTWRGVLSGAIAGTLVFEMQRVVYAGGLLTDLGLFDYNAHPLLPGLLMGLGAGVGDAIKSFFKRRVGIAPGASWLVFDQIDFLIGAYAFVALVFAPPFTAVVACVPVVLLGSVAVTAIGYALGLKEAWI